MPEVTARIDDDDLEDDEFRRECVGCHTVSPATRTAHTLISAQFGWRLTRRTLNGFEKLEWRCPHCYSTFKAALGSPPSSRR